jgi:uncharacterized protein
MNAATRWADHQLFETSGGAILFGVDHGAIFSVDHETRELLLRDPPRREGEWELLTPSQQELVRGLSGIGMLVNGEKRVARPDIDPAVFPLTTLVLEVAQDCNLRCSYCYAEGGSYGKKAALMDPADATRAVRGMLERAGEDDNLTLILFGGEPLLNMPAIEAAVAEVEKGRKEKGSRVSISLTTNGTLLTPEIVQFLRRHRISVSVSMDGPEDLHDENRRAPGGGGSYREIVGRLKVLLDGATAPVAARVTLLPRQWSRVEEVFDHLVGLGFHEVGIAPASPVDSRFLATAQEEDELFQGMAALAGRFLKNAPRGGIPFSNIIDLLARLHVGQTKVVGCGAGLGYLALDAAGGYYLCHRLTGDDDFRVGDLETGAIPAKVTAALAAAGIDRGELCRDCWGRTLCAGGCYYENVLRERHLGLPAGTSCGFILRWLRLGIESYAALLENGGDSLLQRLEKRGGC